MILYTIHLVYIPFDNTKKRKVGPHVKLKHQTNIRYVVYFIPRLISPRYPLRDPFIYQLGFLDGFLEVLIFLYIIKKALIIVYYYMWKDNTFC